MRNLSITTRMLVVALAPAVLVAGLLSAWFLFDRVRDVERAEMNRARTLAESLALASEFGVATANAELLADIAGPTLAIPSIVAVRFDGIEGETLQVAGMPDAMPRDVDGLDHHRWWASLIDPTRLREIVEPVRRTDLSAFDEPLFVAPDGDALERGVPGEVPDAAGTGAAGGSRIGTLRLTIDLSSAYHRQLDAVGRALLVTALVLLFATPAAIWLARGVSRPVRELTHSMDRLARHDYFDRTPVRTGGELGELAHGVLRLSIELNAFHARLQESARVATDDLHIALDALERRNRELDEARAAAERASAFKSEFLANMSHEIRTPMNTVIGLLSTLRRTPLTADQGEQVALIDGASTSLLALIDDILDITRIETGHLRVERVPCELEPLLAEIAHAVAGPAIERGIELGIAPLPPEMPRSILGDPLRLRQVMLNLLSNAIKFTPRGHVLLELSAGRSDDGTRTLHLSVSDTGIGIAEDAQRRLFGAFAQADMSTTRLYGGAGLGLHICRGIVTLMGGTIALESAPGKGSRFDVTLPMTPLSSGATTTAPGASAAAPLAVRYVDPYPPLEAINRRALALAGVPATPVPGASEASTLLIGVPNRFLQENDPEEPVGFPPPDGHGRRLALVTRITPDVRRRLRAAGFDGCVPRTPHVRELRHHLESALRNSPRAPAPARPPGMIDRLALPDAGRSSRTGTRPIVLAVDDQQMNLDLLARYFTHLDVDGRFARTDAEAARELAARRFDLILLDLHMPDRDGFETASELRASESPNRATPLVALTADAYADSRARALESGFDAVLTKPVTLDQVRAELERRVPRCRRAAPLGVASEAHDPTHEPVHGHVHGASHDEVQEGPRDDVRDGTHAPIISIAACAAGMLGNVEWATGAIATYVEEIPQHVDAFDRAIARRDGDALFQAAHSLKGVSDICRVAPVADAARRVERALADGDWHVVATLRDELATLLELAAEQGERELAGGATIAKQAAGPSRSPRRRAAPAAPRSARTP